jgi:hypothetical protein
LRDEEEPEAGGLILRAGSMGLRDVPQAWVLAALLLAPVVSLAAPATRVCSKLELTGEVSAGKEWKAPMGQGWVFRLVPIKAAGAGAASLSATGMSGWDMVVDLDAGAGYPDALLLASPPYNSINEREVGTTYGLRAQDAIGWNPRSFHFLTDAAALREGQKLFVELNRQSAAGQSNSEQAPQKSAAMAGVMNGLMKLVGGSSAGDFRILDAKVAPGNSDAAPYAENWALQSVKTPHSYEQPAGTKPTALGQINWMKFSIQLYLPAGWKTPAGSAATRGACG